MRKRWIFPLMALMGVADGAAFVSSTTKRRLSTQTRKMNIDPNDVLHAHPHLEALLSTLYAQVLQPAHEHTQPLFGPPDPILSAGKSIIPSQNAFVDAGLADTIKASTVDVPSKVTEAISKTPSKFVIDPKAIISFDQTFPGFAKTGHFLPGHSASFPEETPESLKQEMASIAKMMRVVNVLPWAAFIYTCVEFALIKPGYDAYKEELDEDRAAANVEFMALTGIRLAIFSVIGVLALTFFAK